MDDILIERRETVDIIELFDDDGEKVVFEVLDEIECNGDIYYILTPYYVTEEEYSNNTEDLFIMKKFICDDKAMLETLSIAERHLHQEVYDLFKAKYADKFEFKN